MEAEKHQEGGGAAQSPREREEEYINHPSAVLCSAVQVQLGRSLAPWRTASSCTPGRCGEGSAQFDKSQDTTR